MVGVHLKFGTTPDDFLEHLTEAAYQSVLRHGLPASFLEVELDIYEALRSVLKEHAVISPLCGTLASCAKAQRYQLWSDEARQFFPI